MLARGEKAARKFVVGNAVQDGLRVFRRAADGAEGVRDARGKVLLHEGEEALHEIGCDLGVRHAVAGQDQPHHVDVGVGNQHVIERIAVRPRQRDDAAGKLRLRADAHAHAFAVPGDLLADAGDVVEVLRGVPLARPGNLAVPDVIGDADGGDAVPCGVVHDGFHRLHGVRGAGGEVGVDVQIVQRRMQGKSSFFRPSGATAPAERRSTAERRG